MSKLVLIIIFLLICGLLFVVVCLVRTFFSAKIILDEFQYFSLFTAIAIISFLTGIAFMLPQKAWTIENLILKLDNPLIINSTIINLQQKKLALIERDPVLCKIPDTVHVIIDRTEIKNDKKK